MKNGIVSIDPGVELGWALWEEFPQRKSKLRRCGVCLPRNPDASWEQRCNETLESLNANVLHWLAKLELRPRWVVCEYPAFMGSAAGIMVASAGDLVKLAHMCGRIHQNVLENWALMSSKHYVFAEVGNWKGQLPKKVVNRRILKMLGNGALSQARASRSFSHDWDAIGIGLWFTGRFG